MTEYHELAQRTAAPITPDTVARIRQPEVMADLIAILANIKNFGEQLTKLKKYVFYGKGPFEARFVENHRTKEAVHKIRYDWEVKFLHGILGLISESGEMAEMLFNWLYQDAGLSIDNVVEELGDNAWFSEEMLEALKQGGYDINMSDIHRANILKLAARYGDKFKEDRAILRNLDAERLAREGAFSKKAMKELPGNPAEEAAKKEAAALNRTIVNESVKTQDPA